MECLTSMQLDLISLRLQSPETIGLDLPRLQELYLYDLKPSEIDHFLSQSNFPCLYQANIATS